MIRVSATGAAAPGEYPVSILLWASKVVCGIFTYDPQNASCYKFSTFLGKGKPKICHQNNFLVCYFFTFPNFFQEASILIPPVGGLDAGAEPYHSFDHSM